MWCVWTTKLKLGVVKILRVGLIYSTQRVKPWWDLLPSPSFGRKVTSAQLFHHTALVPFFLCLSPYSISSSFILPSPFSISLFSLFPTSSNTFNFILFLCFGHPPKGVHGFNFLLQFLHFVCLWLEIFTDKDSDQFSTKHQYFNILIIFLLMFLDCTYNNNK